MPEPKLEDVFKLSGVPTYTFVKPAEYTELLVSLRTPGRGLVIEGPSGIGKTSAVTKALEELGIADTTLKLTARKKEDRAIIAELPNLKPLGTVIVDDFHTLDEDTKRTIADFLKTLADEEDPTSKLIIVGINRAGDSLVKFANDLNNRIDTLRFEANPEEKIRELIQKGENELKVRLSNKEQIVAAVQGSFHLTQILCHKTCVIGGITEACETVRTIEVSFEVVKQRVLDELARLFFDVARKFATGPKLRREGRAPYLHMLHWLATQDDWSLQLDQAMAQHPEHKGSVSQVIDKGYLESFLRSDDEFSKVLHYDPNTRMLTVEDPKFVFYLRNLSWSKFARQVGYINIGFDSRYDFALSFSGADRELAESLAVSLASHEVAVFYDKHEQHRILAENVEEYLAPIYRSDARFVICLLSKTYPKRIWTKFESEVFKTRFGDGSVIPIWFTDTEPGMFDESTRVGGLTYDPHGDMQSQVDDIVEVLLKKLAEDRAKSAGLAG